MAKLPKLEKRVGFNPVEAEKNRCLTIINAKLGH
jgi:hypothetical protein